MKWKSLILILGVIGIIVAISGCTSSNQTSTYNGSKFSLQYPSGWNVTEKGEGVEIKEGNSSTDDNYQVLYIKHERSSEFSTLSELGADYQGVYKNNATNITYDVFTQKNSEGLTETTYLFTKNGKDYEIRGVVLKTDPDPYELTIETIK